MDRRTAFNRTVKRWPGWLLLAVVAAVLLAVGVEPRQRRQRPGRAGRRPRPARRLPGVRRRERLRVAQPGVDQPAQRDHRPRQRGPPQRRRDPRRDPVGVPERHPARPAGRRRQRPRLGAAGGAVDLRRRRPRRRLPPVAARGWSSASRATRIGRSSPRRSPPGDDRWAADPPGADGGRSGPLGRAGGGALVPAPLAARPRRRARRR